MEVWSVIRLAVRENAGLKNMASIHNYTYAKVLLCVCVYIYIYVSVYINCFYVVEPRFMSIICLENMLVAQSTHTSKRVSGTIDLVVIM